MVSKYFVTSAQAAARPHSKFMQSAERYCTENDAGLIVLPMIGQNAREDMDQLHANIASLDIEPGTRKLNSNIQIEQFNVRPYQVDPITGLNRFAQRGTSLVFASPKQRLKTIAHSNYKHPKFLLTTGACTMPNYATGMDASPERRRLGNISKRDHEIGGLVVEIENDEMFHVRHVKSNTSGDFVDLGRRYEHDGVKESSLEALVLGDWHNGKTDPTIRDTTYQMINDLKPKRIFLHDFFDGWSVSHWADKTPIRDKLLQTYDKGLRGLDQELKEAYTTLCELAETGAEINVVASNHLEFLDRYLEEGRFMKDPGNFRTANSLLGYMAAADYNNPVEQGVKMHGKLPSNVRFMKRDEDYKVRGYQLGAHGDKGPGGGKGSIISKEHDYGKSITGHVHRAEKLRNTYTVGVMKDTNQFFTRGQPMNWTHSHAAIWDTGSVQLLNILDGKYKL